MDAWVLWHGHHDGSGFTVSRVYFDEVRAKEDHDLLAKQPACGSEWHLDKVPVIGEFGGKKAQGRTHETPRAANAAPGAQRPHARPA